MSRIAIFFLLVISPLLAMLLAVLGFETIATNPLGWLLALVGIGYISGIGIVYFFRKERFWESVTTGVSKTEEHGDRSFWLIALGIVIPFFLSPVDYLYFSGLLPRNPWMYLVGMILTTLGIVLFVWARRALNKNYSAHISVKSEQPLVQSGPYCLIRHPAYCGYLLLALGLSIGYSSLFGLISVFVVLLPCLIYRIRAEEKLLLDGFGNAYSEYMRKTKRIIPWIW